MYIRYKAPAILNVRNNTADVLRTTPSPSIAAVERVKSPNVLPSVEKATAFISYIMELLIASNMAGPGLKIATIATVTNKNHV